MTSTKARTGGSKAKGRSVPVVAIVFGVIAVALVAAVAFGGNSEVQSEYGTPTVEGALPLMPPNASVDTSAAGLEAPTIVGEDFDGNTVSITNDGRAKAIVFVAHWCPHCQQEVPRVQAWLDQGGGVEGVDIYSVSSAMNSGRPNYPPSAWLEREGWTVPVIRDDADNSALIAYGAGGFPYWVFVNADGTVALRTAGQTTIEQLVATMEQLDKG